MLSVNIATPHDLCIGIARRAKERRLSLNITQQQLAERSGVSLASLKRFERTGEIAFSALLALALVLNELAAFDALFASQPPLSLFAPEPKPRLRARGKP